MLPQRIVIGLGNPGSLYQETRHNAGFLVLDHLAREKNARFRKPFFRSWTESLIEHENVFALLVKPLTYMNRSGEILPQLLARYPLALDRILVITDQMDLPPGTLRLKMKGGAGGQKGVRSIIDTLGTPEFPKLYVGIGKPESASMTIPEWVLSPPSEEEKELWDLALVKATKVVKEFILGRTQETMNWLNAKNA